MTRMEWVDLLQSAALLSLLFAVVAHLWRHR